MAKYSIEGKNHNINLEQFTYTAYAEGDNYVRLNWKYKNEKEGFAPSLAELVKFDTDLQDENIPLFGLYLYYSISEKDEIVLDYLCYEKGYNEEEVKFELNQSEKRIFQKILANSNKWQ